MCVYIDRYIHKSTYVCICKYLYVYINICVYIYMYICICVCIYIYAEVYSLFVYVDMHLFFERA